MKMYVQGVRVTLDTGNYYMLLHVGFTLEQRLSR